MIARDTAAEAWAEADRLLDAMDPAVVAAAQAAVPRGESVGQQRMAALHGGSRDVAGDLPQPVGRDSAWCGAGPARRWSAATSRWPSASRSTTRSASTTSSCPGQPHLEECYWFGEGVLPLLRGRGLLSPAAG